MSGVSLNVTPLWSPRPFLRLCGWGGRLTWRMSNLWSGPGSESRPAAVTLEFQATESEPPVTWPWVGETRAVCFLHRQYLLSGSVGKLGSAQPVDSPRAAASSAGWPVRVKELSDLCSVRSWGKRLRGLARHQFPYCDLEAAVPPWRGCFWDRW